MFNNQLLACPGHQRNPHLSACSPSARSPFKLSPQDQQSSVHPGRIYFIVRLRKKILCLLHPKDQDPHLQLHLLCKEVPGQKELRVPTVHSSLGVLWHLEGLPTLYQLGLL